MTIRHLESFRDWAIQVNSEYDDWMAKEHVDTCRHIQDVLRNRE